MLQQPKYGSNGRRSASCGRGVARGEMRVPIAASHGHGVPEQDGEACALGLARLLTTTRPFGTVCFVYRMSHKGTMSFSINNMLVTPGRGAANTT